MTRRLFNRITLLSLTLWVVGCGIDLIQFPDNDLSVFWSWCGGLYCIDTIVDPQVLTLRRFDPWPSDVPLQWHICNLEGGSEVPSARREGLWVDQDNQPVSRGPAAHHALRVREQVLFRLNLWLWLVLTGVAPVVWMAKAGRINWQAARRRHRRQLGVCENCGYDLRASKDRCPECGAAIAGAAPFRESNA